MWINIRGGFLLKKSIALLLLVLMAFSIFAGAVMASEEKTPEEIAAEEARQRQLAIYTLIILAVVAFFFITELIPLAVTAMSAPVALNLTGVLTPAQAISGLSNSNTVLFGGMFVVGAALFETGAAGKIGDWVVSKAKGNPMLLLLGVMLITAGLSGVLSNTGTTAVMLPLAIGIAGSAGINRSKILMPLALAAGLGGTITLVGTPPNLLVNGVLEGGGYNAFGFFEFGIVGVPMTIVGIIFLLTPIGQKLLPDRKASEEAEAATAAAVESELGGIVEKPVSKQYISAAILIGVVIIMATGIMNLTIAAILGAIVCVLTGTIDEKKAYASIDWVTIFLFAGMLPLADAMAQTGAGKMIADVVIGGLGESASPFVLMTAIFWLTCILSQFMSNTACTALFAPIALSIAEGMGASPYAVLMTTAMAASCAFATPVGTPPNTLVLGPGGYRFNDYVKIGVPLIILMYIVNIAILPIFYPFF
jgi:sodium-dependent dicarboxylate transporter 2/3/5